MTKTPDKERFILLMSERNGAWEEQAPDEAKALLEDYFAWVDALAQRGVFQGGEGLQSEGVTVKVVDGQPVDGPFAETKELIAGFFLLEVADGVEALAIAETCPALGHGREVFVAPWCSEIGSTTALMGAPREGCFLLLHYEPKDTMTGLSPQAQQELLIEQMAWIASLREAGTLRYAEAIEPIIARLNDAGSHTWESDMPLSAIYAIEATDQAEALAIAHRCPALAHGAELAVQPVWYVDAERN